MSAEIKNFVDEKTTKLILDALSVLDFDSVHLLAKKSGVPVHRMQSFVDGDEKITQIDKGNLIPHLVALADMEYENDEQDESNTRFAEFKKRMAM